MPVKQERSSKGEKGGEQGGFNTSLFIKAEEAARYRALLQDMRIVPSDEHLKALARLGAKNASALPRQLIEDHFADLLLYNRLEYGDDILAIKQIIERISEQKKALFPDEPQYQDPPRVKLLRAVGPFDDALARYKDGKLDQAHVLYELANILYYNVQDYLQTRDEQSHNGIVRFYAEQVKISPEQALAVTIAKYRCRSEYKDLKLRDRETAVALELSAIERTMKE